jgi:hypothetical protein
MEKLRDINGLVEEFDALWRTYEEVYDMYNTWLEWN